MLFLIKVLTYDKQQKHEQSGIHTETKQITIRNYIKNEANFLFYLGQIESYLLGHCVSILKPKQQREVIALNKDNTSKCEVRGTTLLLPETITRIGMHN